MIGDKQESFIFNSYDDSSFIEFYTFIRDRLYIVFEEYESDLNFECDSILLDFWPVDISNDMKISNLKEVKNRLSSSSFKTVNTGFKFFGNSLFDIYGTPLDVKLSDSILDINGLSEDFYKFKDKFLLNYKSGHKYYHIDDNSKFYLINHQNRQFIIIVDKINNDKVLKRCFNQFGDLITQATDTLLPNNNLRRDSGNFTTILNNNEIIFSERKINFSSIKSDFKLSEDTGLPNTNLGVLDLETYEDDGISKCYAIGFYSSLDENTKTYYINKDLDSVELINRCFEEILRPKYKNTVFYVHNLGRFDAPFIIKCLTLFNKTDQGLKNPYVLDTINRDANILKLTVKRKIDNKYRIVKIQDSAAILPRNLRDLCKDYKVEIVKSYFPYGFTNKNTLFYIGKTPDINYYDNIEIKEYMNLYKEVWNLKEECLIYLDKDLLSLYQVLVKVNKSIHFLFNMQMTESLTISGLAMRIFLTNHYKPENKTIPLIISKNIFDDIHQSYYGGRVEVYNPTNIDNKILYYYDVNSLYPYASLNSIPGIDCTYIECIKHKVNIDDLFGFFYCKIKSDNNYIGLLPVRTKTNLIFPLGEWEGWYFSEELKFAKENGYKIEVVKGYKFNKVDTIFNSFVEDIYKIKNNPRNDTEKNVAKFILNSLIGRFGMNFLKTITKLVDRKGHDLITTTRIQKTYIEIDDNTYLEYYKPNIDKEICQNFGVDYIKALNNENFDETKSSITYRSVSISTASAVLSYARIHMCKIKLHILNNNGNIYYTDTDSIVTDFKLSDEFIHSKEIGKLKLVYEVKEGYFITDKLYAIKTIYDKIIQLGKGIKSKLFKFEDYIKMYNMEIIDYATKITSSRNYQDGSVIIRKKNDITLNTNVYTKRERIFKNGKWIGTKPLTIKSTPISQGDILDNNNDNNNQ
jgi:DNA polymerase family B